MAGFLYLVPLMLQLSFEFTAMRTGLALMPYSISLLIMAIVGSRISSRFFANRLIQAGFVLAAAGLGLMAASIQPHATPEDLVLGAVFGAGMGLVASQILNLIISSVSAERTPETAGLTATFEQLGNAIGVALIGCGGRGTGAAANALSVTNGPVKLLAMADVFEHRAHLGQGEDLPAPLVGPFELREGRAPALPWSLAGAGELLAELDAVSFEAPAR